jgi:hypothetical protein
MTTKSGEEFHSGDLINGYLVPRRTFAYPLSGFINAAALAAGVPNSELPDYTEMLRFTIGTIGSPEFGTLRVAKQNQPRITVRQALDIFWPRARFLFEMKDGPGPAKGRSVAPEHWPVIAALVANQFIAETKEVLDPRVGLRLVMEAAIAMSKVDPKSVPQVWKDAPAPSA